MSPHRIAGVLAAVILCLGACDSASEDRADPDADGVADAGSPEPEDPSNDSCDAIRFGSVDELVVAFNLSGCEPGDGVGLQLTTQPDGSLSCGDTVEVDWYRDQASFEQAKAKDRAEVSLFGAFRDYDGVRTFNTNAERGGA